MIRIFPSILAFILPLLSQVRRSGNFPAATLVATEWADGDSFSVRFPDGKERTVRLYGADCIEMHVKGDDSNARRLGTSAGISASMTS